MRRGRSIVFRGPGIALECAEREVTAPEAHQIVVATTHAGVCGSDGHRLAGDIPAADARPVYFGHEGIGTIVDIGADVRTDRAGTPITTGDRIFWSPPTPCGDCAQCEAGASTALCENMDWPQPVGRPSSASYQDFATLSATTPFFRIPDSTDSDAVIALGCALPTALGGLRNLGTVTDATVCIQGNGPVGLAATMLCRVAGAQGIFVIGDPGTREDAARQLGATEVLALTTTDRTERLKRLMKATNGRGVDVVIEAAGHISAFDEAMALLAKRGRLLVLGLYSGSATTPFDPVLVNNRELRILGSLGCPVEDYGRAMEFAGEHDSAFGLSALVTHRFPLDRVQEAITTAGTGTAIKTVVQPQLNKELGQ
ncbi:zinc-binding dehydrogenase [Rhodococcus erythropolis]|uniref:zinc-binding dehydrogenase n=1 Tax=Rhodococcus erythropolis TaxID=1833 RepID=UPI003798F263